MVRLGLLSILFAGCGSSGLRQDSDGATEEPDLAVVPDGGGGVCAPKCTGTRPHCNAARNCVGCLDDSQCGPGNRCKVVSDSLASCVPGCAADAGCPAGRKCCGGACVDPMADAAHCGACGKPCSGNHAEGKCVGGKCEVGKCDSGWGNCNMNGADGCETNLHVDPQHCTACGMKCAIANAINACADGCYATACNFGFDDCNLQENDGCETSVLMDPANCGACKKSCTKLPNAAAACTSGACVLGACNMGYFNCDNDPLNGCESDLVNDGKNCGACNRPCPMNLPFCGDGICKAAPTGCFRTTDVIQKGLMFEQATKCEKLADNGFTCINPVVRYGKVGGGIPAMHGNNNFALWCQQLGCKGFANQVSYGMRDFNAPNGKLFWCSGYDEQAAKWCDWQDGRWYDMSLDYHQPAADAITSITCN